MKCALSAKMTIDKCRTMRKNGQPTCINCEHAGSFERAFVVNVPITEYQALAKIAKQAEQSIPEVLAELVAYLVRGKLQIIR